jgi:hypothetical protein
MFKQMVYGSLLTLAGVLTIGVHQAQAQSQVTCESYDKRTNYCRIGRHGDVRLVERLSDSRCHEGRDWGVTGDQIWVTDGCRAVFEVDPVHERGYGRGHDRDRDDDRDNRGYGGGRNYDDRTQYITCESIDKRRNYCEVGYHVKARMDHQLSDAPCIRGQTWLDTPNGVWVAGGCRAVFKIK